ncbi:MULTISPECIES: hypothetical protein [unclassified Raoultella]|uniref:hypothetical protein n=1 Tax=unclassified Raoultella TaxID=2627600 RepID=UPI0013585B46|nr:MULTISPECIES: hypothetical protein [unclassified Raoultella]
MTWGNASGRRNPLRTPQPTLRHGLPGVTLRLRKAVQAPGSEEALHGGLTVVEANRY